MTGAELAARVTAASAVLAGFDRQADDYIHARTGEPPWQDWAWRLRTELSGLLLQLGGPDDDDDQADDDDTEAYCTACREWVGIFLGLKGWHHFRGDPAPGGVRTLYTADHPATPGWTVPPGRALSPAGLAMLRETLGEDGARRLGLAAGDGQ